MDETSNRKTDELKSTASQRQRYNGVHALESKHECYCCVSCMRHTNGLTKYLSLFVIRRRAADVYRFILIYRITD